MAEPAPIPTGGDVRDDVEFLAGVEQRLLEGEVVTARDDQLMRRAALAQDGRQGGEEAVDRGGLRARLEQFVELVPQGAGAPHHGHVLRDPGQLRRAARVREMVGETRGQLAHVGTEHRHEATVEHRVDDLREVILRRRRRAGSLE